MTEFGLSGFGGLTPLGQARGDELRRQVRRRIVVILAPTMLLVVAALLLASRRLAGALVEPPAFVLAVLCALVIPATARATSGLTQWSFGNHDVQLPARWIKLICAAPLARWGAAVVWASALSLPGISAAAAAALWAPVVLPAIGVGARLMPWLARGAKQVNDPAGDGSVDSPASSGVSPHDGPAGVAPAPRRPSPWTIGLQAFDKTEEPRAAAGYVTARMARFVTAEGGDVVEGTVKVDFEPGARWGAAHLALCPPLAGEPRVEVSVDDDIDAEIKVTQALRYAVRFDVRLPEPPEDSFSIRLRYRLVVSVDRPSDR